VIGSSGGAAGAGGGGGAYCGEGGGSGQAGEDSLVVRPMTPAKGVPSLQVLIAMRFLLFLFWISLSDGQDWC